MFLVILTWKVKQTQRKIVSRTYMPSLYYTTLETRIDFFAILKIFEITTVSNPPVIFPKSICDPSLKMYIPALVAKEVQIVKHRLFLVNCYLLHGNEIKEK